MERQRKCGKPAPPKVGERPRKKGESKISESHLIEVKQAWRDEYLKWIYDFANAQGGVLYICKRDDGTVCGVANAKKLLEDLPNKVRDTLGLIVNAVREVIFNALIHQDFSACIPV